MARKIPVRIKRPTIGDVARICGLSKTTVSKVMNMSAEEIDLPEVTRQRVLTACRELAYQPSWRARALRHGRTHMIAFFHRDQIPNLGAAWHGLAQRLGERLGARGYQVQSMASPKDEVGWRQTLQEQRFDGCFVFQKVSDAMERILAEQGMPAVFVNAYGQLCSSVSPDDRMGGYLATKHLIDLGHRHVVFVQGDDIDALHFSLQHRVEGYRKAMAEAELTANEPIACSAFDAPKAIVSLAPRPTAAIAYNDMVATPFLHGCWVQNLRVPEDLSVVTFNDTVSTRHSIPPLTCIDVPAMEVAERATSLLLEQIESKEKTFAQHARPQTVVLPERLIVRESSRALRTSS